MEQQRVKLPNHKATVIAISRHRSIVEGYERTLGQMRRRAIETGENFNAQKRTLCDENEKLLVTNASLRAKLEAAKGRECTLFWGVLWFAVGAVVALIALVCLSLAVYP